MSSIIIIVMYGRSSYINGVAQNKTRKKVCGKFRSLLIEGICGVPYNRLYYWRSKKEYWLPFFH